MTTSTAPNQAAAHQPTALRPRSSARAVSAPALRHRPRFGGDMNGPLELMVRIRRVSRLGLALLLLSGVLQATDAVLAARALAMPDL